MMFDHLLREPDPDVFNLDEPCAELLAWMRMGALGFNPLAMKAMLLHGERYRITPDDFYTNLTEDELRFIDEFEKEHNAYVYLLFDTHEPFDGEVLVFFIKNDAKDWIEQSEDIKKNNSLICYGAKSDDLYSGEFKRVCLKKNESGVVLRVK